MTDAIEVKPRYIEPHYSAHDHSTPSTTVVEAPKTTSDNAPTRGIFVSMYENRVIILIIVVVITIVIIIAYFMHKGSDIVTPSAETASKPQTPKPTPIPAPINEQTVPPTIATPASTPQTTPPKVTRESLANILARSRQVEHKATTTPPAQAQYNTRSEEEIIQLMEATPYITEASNTVLHGVERQYNTTTTEPTNTTQSNKDESETLSDNTTNIDDAQSSTTDDLTHSTREASPGSILKGDTCHMILATGRRCRNRAQSQGDMCSRHAQ